MKKAIFILGTATALIVATSMIGCQSSAQKADNAQSKVEDAKADLKDAQKDANVAAHITVKITDIFPSLWSLKQC